VDLKGQHPALTEPILEQINKYERFPNTDEAGSYLHRQAMNFEKQHVKQFYFTYAK